MQETTQVEKEVVVSVPERRELTEIEMAEWKRRSNLRTVKRFGDAIRGATSDIDAEVRDSRSQLSKAKDSLVQTLSVDDANKCISLQKDIDANLVLRKTKLQGWEGIRKAKNLHSQIASLFDSQVDAMFSEEGYPVEEATSIDTAAIAIIAQKKAEEALAKKETETAVE